MAFAGSQPVLGIDIGDTASRCALWVPAAGVVEVLPNARGERSTPSCAFFSRQRQPLVGALALRRGRGGRAERLRHFVGLTVGEADPAVLSARPELRLLESGTEVALSDGSGALPPQSAECLYSLLAADWRSRADVVLSASCTQAVVGVPPQATREQRERVAAACREAGLKTVALLAEPVAARIAAGAALQQHQESVCAVIDVGGTSVVCSLLRISLTGHVTVAAVAGDCGSGAAQVDDAILADLADQWEREAGRPMRDNLRERLRADGQVQQVKHYACSRAARPQAAQQGDTPGLDLNIDEDRVMEWALTPEKLARFAAPVARAAAAAVRDALGAAGIRADGVSEFVLVGGGAALPPVLGAVAAELPHAQQLALPEQCGAAEEAVAVGCALYGASLARRGAQPPAASAFLAAELPGGLPPEGPPLLAAVEGGGAEAPARLANGLGVVVGSGEGGPQACVLLDAGAELPAAASEWLQLPDGDAAVEVVEVLSQGASSPPKADSDPRAARRLGSVTLPGGGGAVRLTLHAAADGALELRCWDPQQRREWGGALAACPSAAAPAEEFTEAECDAALRHLRDRAAALGWFVDVPPLRAAYGVSEEARILAKQLAEAADAAADRSAPGPEGLPALAAASRLLRERAPIVQRTGDARRPLADTAYATWLLATAPRQDDAESLRAALGWGLPLDAPVGRGWDTVLHVIGRRGALRCLVALAETAGDAVGRLAASPNADGDSPISLADAQGHGDVAAALRRLAAASPR